MSWFRKAEKAAIDPSGHVLQAAESYIRDNTALYRHYCIGAIQDDLTGRTGHANLNIHLSDEQVVSIVQRIRDEKGMGPIARHNMPGYTEE